MIRDCPWRCCRNFTWWPLTYFGKTRILKIEANGPHGCHCCVLEDAERLVREYPWLEEIYEEMAMLRQRPEEVLGMFSEALRILDENTAKYMIEELQKKVEEKDALLDRKDAVIHEQGFAIDRISAENEELKRQLKELSEKIPLGKQS